MTGPGRREFHAERARGKLRHCRRQVQRGTNAANLASRISTNGLALAQGARPICGFGNWKVKHVWPHPFQIGVGLHLTWETSAMTEPGRREFHAEHARGS